MFLVYTSFAGGSTPAIQPSQLAQHDGRVQLGGVVVGPLEGDARGDGLRFSLRDVKGSETASVVYRGSVPDLFQVGREVIAEGERQGGVFVADKLVTKCPSKYTPANE